MEYRFRIKNDRLETGGHPFGITGNVNTYVCRFDIECSIQGLMWFCIFKQGENVYRQLVENGCCIIPQEVLKNPEPLYIGCYGTNADDNIKRVSTNLICFDIKQGAYSESTMPDVPTPDVWEMLVSKCVPIIGENGNWFVYDIKHGKYVDTGYASKGEGAVLTEEQLENINSLEDILIEDGNGYVPRARWADNAGLAQIADCDDEGDMISEKYAKKTKVSTDDATTAHIFSFIDMYSQDLRLLVAMEGIMFVFDDDAYESDYISGLSFNSGETPTTISYTNSGILNWVGTDCTNADGLSIFQPSANTHYDIVFYFNGTQMIGLVNGFVPASGNEAV